MSRGTKWSVSAVVVAGVVAFIVLVAAKRDNSAVAVRIEPVQRRDLVASVTASGQVSAHTKVDLAADISGRIVKLAVKEGDRVTKGQFLLEIDPAQYEAALQQSEAALASARAQLAQAKANLELAQGNYQRSAAIRKSNAQLISDEQLQQLKTAVDVNQALYEAARHQIDQAQAQVANSQSSLAKTKIFAPMSGRITRLDVEQGETAVPGTFNKDAATLLTISDMTVLETKVDVDETEVSQIDIGDSAVVQLDAFPDTTFVGRVVEISNSSVRAAAAQPDQAVNYEVTIRLLNPPPDTRPDFSTTAKVVTDIRRQVLSVPIIALTVREHEQTAPNTDSAAVILGKKPTKEIADRDVEGVFVVGKDMKVVFRPVQRGIAGEEYFEVRSGLREGERIVAGSYQAIRDLREGALVREQIQPDTAKKKAVKA